MNDIPDAYRATAVPIYAELYSKRAEKLAPDGRVKAPKGVPFIDMGGKVITAEALAPQHLQTFAALLAIQGDAGMQQGVVKMSNRQCVACIGAAIENGFAQARHHHQMPAR